MSKIVAEEILFQLVKVQDWWRSQRVYHMYSSSILLTYDAQALDPNFQYSHLNRCVRVLLIDFAHVVPANGILDLNYLYGLDNFIETFKVVTDLL